MVRRWRLLGYFPILYKPTLIGRGTQAPATHHAGDPLAEDDVHLRDAVRPRHLVLHHLGLRAAHQRSVTQRVRTSQ
jgi:hypothetical protein